MYQCRKSEGAQQPEILAITKSSGELDSELAELEARLAKLKEARAARALSGDGCTLLSSPTLSFSVSKSKMKLESKRSETYKCMQYRRVREHDTLE